MRYLEDFEVGQTLQTGSYTVTREELVAFAQAYDPQPFHLDEEAGRATHFGGLVASGWQTAAIGHRLFVDAMRDTAGLGSPGVDELRWREPVRPGDTLTLHLTVLEVTPSRSKPERGSLKSLFELKNQHGRVVMSHRGIGMIARRPR